MSKNIQSYDDPNYTIRREQSGMVLAATSSFVQFQFFQKVRLNSVRAMVLTAGTATATPADASLEISLYGPGGTTSIGNFAYTTNTAGKLFQSTVTHTIAANNGVRFAKLLDATGINAVAVEYEVLPDAVQS